jgi:hypothetical protein
MAEKIAVSLRELRRYTQRTQSQAASAARMTQPELSRLERREDFLLSTLQAYVGALGGSLEVLVSFGSSTFRLVDADRPRGGFAMTDIEAALEDLASLDAWLPAVLAGLDAAELARRVPGCGSFALVEHVCHLRDLEVEGYGVRLRRTLAADVPHLPDLDGDRLAAERKYLEQAHAPALRALLAARRRNVERLRRVRLVELKRELELDGVGRIPLGDLVLRWRTHDVGHRIEMERLGSELRQSHVTGPSPRIS